MEREYRIFKRTIKPTIQPTNYREDVRTQMQLVNFRNDIQSFDKEIVALASNSKLASSIKSLPAEIQKKIYITMMRTYWKDVTLNTSLRPIWYDSKSYMDKQKSIALFDNVHFLHLECNTLESMKTWIPGCQCEFCLNDKIETRKKEIYQTIYDTGSEFVCSAFQEKTQCYDDIPNFWNIYMMLYWNPIGETSQMKVFDPLKNQFGDEFAKIHADPIESPIYFSDEIVSQYN